ncbi:hypothetical protein [Nocardioides sp.]|jgi:hypothetical protein|uniref:hypothetical protein n=1 Tax=Nocardioides sp. TaxID=35761 RepID=UPI002CA5C8F5|nr:hypothetical protein [Nocardioides sp.]HVX52986.1 hypothetical protein [Nocardioides sp.]
MTNTSLTPILRTQADVEQLWRTLMQPLGWSRRAWWFALVGPDDHPLRQLGEFEDLPPQLPPEEVAQAARLWRGLLDELLPGGRVALLICRPGRGGPTIVDRDTAAAVYDACREAAVPLEVIHLATDEDVWPLPADEVLSRGA